MQVSTAALVETPEQIYRRIFREMRPRTPLPRISIEFCKFANANSFIKMAGGLLQVRITDVLQGAPGPIHEALAHILLAKLFRRPVARMFSQRYRLYFSRQEVRRSLHLVRQIRGRKFISGSKGKYYDLQELFEDLNFRFFHGLMARPLLGWSRRRSRTTLGHFDPSHNAIIISSLLDSPDAALAVEYVLYHEMLHLKFPAQHRCGRRSVHTREFKEAEKEFPRLKEAKELLRRL